MLNQRDEKIKLADFAGEKNVVLYFYPKALTPGCTTQACGIRDSRAEFEALDTVVLGVSPDPVTKLNKFIDKHELNFDLLSDEDHAIADKYGAWGLKKFMGKEYMGILRSTFIIDKAGKLQHIISKVKTKSHHDDVSSWISSNIGLIFVFPWATLYMSATRIDVGGRPKRVQMTLISIIVA